METPKRKRGIYRQYLASPKDKQDLAKMDNLANYI